MIKFTLDDVLEALGAALFERGQTYVEGDLVSALHHDGDVIDASVDDIDGQRYTQVVALSASGAGLARPGLIIGGHCSCQAGPLQAGPHCAHVAAVLIEHLRLAQKHWGTVQAPTTSTRRTPVRGAPARRAPVRASAAPPASAWAAAPIHRLCFVLLPGTGVEAIGLIACQAKQQMQVRGFEATVIRSAAALLSAPPFPLEPGDPQLLERYIALGLGAHGGAPVMQGKDAARLLADLLAQGKLAWADSVHAMRMSLLEPLLPGQARRAVLAWRSNGQTLQLGWQFAPTSGVSRHSVTQDIEHVLPTDPPWYVHQHACGELIVPDDSEQATLLERVRRSPVLEGKNAAAILRQLASAGMAALLPVPNAQQQAMLHPGHIKTELLLGCIAQRIDHLGRGMPIPAWHDYAMLVVSHDGKAVSADIAENFVWPEAKTPDWVATVLDRDNPQRDAMEQLRHAGFRAAPSDHIGLRTLRGALVLPSSSAWIKFARSTLPELEQAGWHIKKMRYYRYDAIAIDGWYSSVDESGGNAWFDLELGIVVDQKRTSLLPVLIELIRSAPHEFDPALLACHADDDEMMLDLPDGMRVALPWGRIKLILNTLGELYFSSCSGAALRLSTLDAARLAELAEHADLRWVGAERMKALAHRLGNFDGILPVAAPNGLNATLRDYQGAGLAWMQFLREYDLAGILADDMGLGKTIQTLAHILLEKEAGRLDRPVLVVAPTSLMGNWQDEAARFAPSLRVMVLQGVERLERFEQMAQHDLVLTTYALLPRDEEKLRQQPFHLLILDEAQYIKNPRSKASQTANLLQARHRLCLTGTPLENHLGELWSQFHFLLPGLLGSETSFNRDFRHPIEKLADMERRTFLRRRLKPFMLRRTKDTVARELPPKTEMVRMIELSGPQRDLYETVRVAMDKKVRDAIGQKGVARSHIIILEALLKLRQVCCDPRLLALHQSQNTAATSAKLAELLDMLEELLGENRKILVFSQFTSMLALIEAELKARNIGYAKLTGATKDRAGAVRSFQLGEVPLFLISLKAGGVGLNLTAADTVIHYDPWWNPAAENQATDRAWRIGQDKAVFVYRLIAKGTVEEKIQVLQQKKAALASAILAGGEAQNMQVTVHDLQSIFAPLPH